jgi:hypothetical protein
VEAEVGEFGRIAEKGTDKARGVMLSKSGRKSGRVRGMERQGKGEAGGESGRSGGEGKVSGLV